MTSKGRQTIPEISHALLNSWPNFVSPPVSQSAFVLRMHIAQQIGHFNSGMFHDHSNGLPKDVFLIHPIIMGLTLNTFKLGEKKCHHF